MLGANYFAKNTILLMCLCLIFVSCTEANEDSADVIAEEIGDMLFCCVNMLRHLKRDPEIVMKQSNDKFEKRYKAMEKMLKANDNNE